MSEREKTLKSKAYQQLKYVYENKEEVLLQFKKLNKKIVGTLGCDVPDELIIAAGLLPIRVYGNAKLALHQADKYLEFSFDPVVRSYFEKLVDGTYHSLFNYVAISNSTDVLIRIYFYLREIRRLEPDKPVPPITFIDWLFTRFRMHQVRNEETIKKFKITVEDWAGKKISYEELTEAIRICNENRQLLEKFSSLRYGETCKVKGSEALKVIGSSLFMQREAHSDLLKELINEANEWDTIDDCRLYLTGSIQENTDLYELIETCGGNIVSEDHDWGDRHWNRQINTEIDPIKGIVDRYMLRSESAKKAFVSQRVDALINQVEKSKAQAVLFYMHRYDDAGSWDYPSQKKALDEAGIPSLLLVNQSYDLVQNNDLKERLSAFILKMKGGKA